MHRRWILCLPFLPFLLAACAAVGPDHQAPTPELPAQWSSPLPHGGSVQGLADWWQRFDDPVLARLQQAAEADSPTLATAWANVELARATLASAGAGGSPTLTAGASATRARQQASGSGAATSTTRAASLDASWELDLFGKQRRKREAAQAQVQARGSDWHDARVSLAAEVASSYVEYRACMQLAAVYRQEELSVAQTEQATTALVRAGLSAAGDLALAQATQSSTAASLVAQRSQCELLQRSLTNLTGLQDAELRPLLDGGRTALPAAPAFAVSQVPAQALRQRPDVASRERDLAAASASVGVAVAGLYPSVQLGGSLGLSVAGGTSLTTWSFGPSISLPLLDGGSRRAAVDSARASHELAYAQWRDTVRNAATEVEKALLRLADAGQRAEQSQRTADAYRRYLQGAEAERRAGSISLLTYEEARRQALQAQLDLIGLQRDRLSYGIALYKALGGGWDSAAPGPVTPPRSRVSETPAS